MKLWRLGLAALVLFCGLPLGAAAADADPAGRANAPAQAAPAEAPLTVFNRQVMVFRAPFMGAQPALRAARARVLIEEALAQAGPLEVTVHAHSDGQLVMVDGRLAFVVTAGDVDPVQERPLREVADQAARQLRTVVAETRESRNLEALVRALASIVGVTLVFAALLWLLARVHAWGTRKVLVRAGRRAGHLKMADTRLINRHQLLKIVKHLLDLLRWSVVLVLSYEWLSFSLTRFPYTRPWGELLHDNLLAMAQALGSGIGHAIPGLGVCVMIFFTAQLFIGFLDRLFQRIAKSDVPPHWLSPETVGTTRKLAAIATWLFAIAMAYPYLPGSQSEAFKGLSVLLGLMISLGSSSLVAQGAAGLILTYTRTLRPGEYVRVGDHEGTVMETGMFTTRIQTGLGEELTLPNSMITGSVTKNYSRTVHGRGYVIDTTVTIGYDTPWRQVEAMLCEAARRTSGILDSPPPQVFQTALSDHYPEYRLVAQAIPSSPRPRAQVLSQLHANIQDVFNEYGVQIMSPHYMADPGEPKTVKPEAWYPAPVRRESP